ncbi:MAG: ankyrin repeat domain-containing protein [Gammaproteobacteria bacterium]|nr:ankyrin repeat domain-containing protein [Gammaproteobacteria bacterium]MBQ0838791.1 ankyrin repeat domain-containing protein [Gammaproteobacteria bacterium]
MRTRRDDRLLKRLKAGSSIIALSLLIACTPADESAETSKVSEPFISSPKACASGQLSIKTGYGDYPGLDCSQLVDQVNDNPEKTHYGYRRQCKKLSGTSHVPESVAAVQVNECAPMRESDKGSNASMLVCCQLPEPEVTAEIIAYEAILNCPKNHLQALATGLHYPNNNCADAASRAELALSSSHYQGACAAAAKPYTQQRQRVLDVAVFTCKKDQGSYLDVAVCCSATLPKGRSMHPLEIPSDIWEVLRTNDIFALKILLSREPGRARETGDKDITPLHRAGSLAVVNALLAKQPNRNAQDLDGFTPLHAAVMANRYEIAARLLDVGAKVDVTSKFGDTALSFSKKAKIAELLLSHKAKVNGIQSSAGSPLHSAAFYGRTDVAEVLLDHGANINSLDVNGETPLHRAAFAYSRTSINVARLLIDRGSDVNAKAKSQGQKTPLDMSDKAEIRAFIISKGGISGR